MFTCTTFEILSELSLIDTTAIVYQNVHREIKHRGMIG